MTVGMTIAVVVDEIGKEVEEEEQGVDFPMEVIEDMVVIVVEMVMVAIILQRAEIFVQGPGHVVVIEWGIVVVVVVVMEQETADIAVNHPEEGIAAMIIDGSLKTRQINKPTEDIQ